LRATTDQGTEETYLHTEGLYSKVQPPPPFSNGSVTKLGEDGKIYGVYWNDEYGPVAYVFDGVDAYDLTDSIGAWRGVYFIQAIAGVNGSGQIITSAWHRIQHRWLAVVLTPLAIAATQ
jgi:hypothetical protein